jgi:hypothetical protein
MERLLADAGLRPLESRADAIRSRTRPLTQFS